jgi:hypothetical protein
MAGDSSPLFQCFFYGLGTHPYSYNAFLMGWGCHPHFSNAFLMAGDSSPLFQCFSYGWGLIPTLIMLFLWAGDVIPTFPMLFLWLGTHPHFSNAFLMAGDINIECGDGWGQLYPSPLCNAFLMGDFIPTSSPLFQCFSYGVGIK